MFWALPETIPDYQSVIVAAKKLPKPVVAKAKIKDADVWITEGVAYAKSTVYKAPIVAGSRALLRLTP